MPEELPPPNRKSDQNASAVFQPESVNRRSPSLNGSAPAFDPSQDNLPAFLVRLLQAYPYLQRHPHPFLVHFSIVFIYAAAFLSLLFLVGGPIALEISAFYCVGAGLIFLPPVMLTGELTRRINYSRKPKQLFDIEIRYSWSLLILWAGIFIWRWFDASILQDFGWLSLLYMLLLFVGVVIVTIISFHGGMLTFPLEKNTD
jgi:uncharacterized membrane protein